MFYKSSRRMECLVCGLVGLVDCLVRVLSLGFFGTNFEANVLFYFHDRAMKKAIAKREAEREAALLNLARGYTDV